jgi:Cu(I)/Ag(I) efflux system membrane fusion protein/cobalt-zinc-cadmium efflux system membrane fusion protein
LNKIFRIALFFSAIFVLTVFTSCSQDNKKHEHQSMNMDKKNIDSTIVRVGEIDLQAIDKNKDGMVYQDPMDWNVISDEAGKCPLCNMSLEEVSIKQAKENLIKHNFKVKEK